MRSFYSRHITMIIFDLDGTLWDSSLQVAQSWNIILEEYGSKMAPETRFPQLTADDIRSVMGMTMEEIANVLMPDLDPQLRSVIFKKCETYEVTYIGSHGGILFPDVRETLTQLKEQGHEMAIVSNCQVGYIPAFLKSMKMDSYFCDYEEWGRTGKSKGNNIRLVMERRHCRDAVYVGDTQKDKDAADEAGIPFIWASYGFGTVSEYAGKMEKFQDLLTVSASIQGI